MNKTIKIILIITAIVITIASGIFLLFVSGISGLIVIVAEIIFFMGMIYMIEFIYKRIKDK
jgi:hypothetical protein